LAWYRKLIARKFDGSKYRQYPGRPKVGREVAELVSRSQGPGEYRVGYDRIAGALSNLGHDISDQTVGNILRHFGIAPAPKRRQNTNWADFIRSHMAVSGWDRFLHVEARNWRGLATYYVLFFIHLETRRVTLVGITKHPTEHWMSQMARNTVYDGAGALRQIRFALHERDSKFCASFRATLSSGGVWPLALPARSPNLNAFAETMGAIGEERVPIETDLVRRALAAACRHGVLGALPL
jgi:putative transposase